MPLQGRCPGGGNYSERPKGYILFSGGARGSVGRFSANVSCSHPQGAKGKVKERAIQESPIGDHTVFQRASPYLAARRGRRAPRGQRARTGRVGIPSPVEGRYRTCRRGQAPALRGRCHAWWRAGSSRPTKGSDTDPVGAGFKPACPLGTTRPGGGEFSERSQGYDVFSGSGARGNSGRPEGAAGQSWA